MTLRPELQREAKGFFTNPISSYEQTLEKVHMDYRAQESGESIRDTATGSALALRGTFDAKIEGKKTANDLVLQSGRRSSSQTICIS